MKDVIRVIDKALKRRKISARQASLAATGKDGAIKNLKAGHSPSYESIEALFKYLGINLTYSIDGDVQQSNIKVPMLGYISAGGNGCPDDISLTYIPENDNPDETAAPPGMYMQLENAIFAVRVRGNSMRPTYNDGDTLFMYKDDPVRADIERMLGLDCAVTLENGDIFVKRLRRPDSGIDGEWNLESLNPVWPIMTDQRLTDALPVRHVTRKV